MRVELGDHVYSQDGHDLGKVKHLILDPADNRVKTVVVEKGILLHDDIEIPLNALQGGDERQSGGQVHVAYTAAQVKTLPRFDIAQYTPAPPFHEADGIANTTGGLLFTGGYVAQPFAGAAYPMGAGVLPFTAPLVGYGGEADQREGRIQETTGEQPDPVGDYRRREDETNAVISEGDQVVSSDGEIVGEVHSLVIDTASGRPTALVVRRGALFTHDTTLLADSIASVDDGVVTLTLNKSQLPS